MSDLLHNPHPGELLLEELLRPLGISQNRLARSIGVPPRRINEIVPGKRCITVDTDLRLARFFGMSEGFWMGLQSDYDLMDTRRRLADRLEREVRPLSSAAAGGPPDRSIGQGMKATQGKANPRLVNEVLRKRLGG